MRKGGGMKCYKCGVEVVEELHKCVFGNPVDYRKPEKIEVCGQCGSILEGSTCSLCGSKVKP
jgi:hypothetical protein